MIYWSWNIGGRGRSGEWEAMKLYACYIKNDISNVYFRKRSQVAAYMIY